MMDTETERLMNFLHPRLRTGTGSYTVTSVDGAIRLYTLDVEEETLSFDDVTFVRVDEARNDEYLTLLVYSYDEG